MIALLWLLAAQADPQPDGAALYKTYCSVCHGASGGGDGPVGTALTPRPARFADPTFWETRDDERLKKVVIEGGPSVGASPLMAGFQGRLDEPQVDAIVAYLRSTYAPADTGP